MQAGGLSDRRQYQQRDRYPGRPGVAEVAIAVAISFPANQSVTIFDMMTLRSTPPAPDDEAACDLPAPQIERHHDEIAGEHQRQRQLHGALVAETFADGAARQCNRDARREIEPDQEADVGNVDAELRGQERRDRGDALELKRHRQPHGEENGENDPAVAQSVPLQMSKLRRRCTRVKRSPTIAALNLLQCNSER